MSDTYKPFDAVRDEPQHTRDHKPFHQDHAKVMETLIEPVSAHFQYVVGQYVYVHQHAYETNDLSARECCIVDVTNAPLEITVRPCNSDELITVAQDKLSAPIWV
jgi:hypothetical protein